MRRLEEILNNSECVAVLSASTAPIRRLIAEIENAYPGTRPARIVAAAVADESYFHELTSLQNLLLCGHPRTTLLAGQRVEEFLGSLGIGLDVVAPNDFERFGICVTRLAMADPDVLFVAGLAPEHDRRALDPLLSLGRSRSLHGRATFIACDPSDEQLRRVDSVIVLREHFGFTITSPDGLTERRRRILMYSDSEVDDGSSVRDVELVSVDRGAHELDQQLSELLADVFGDAPFGAVISVDGLQPLIVDRIGDDADMRDILMASFRSPDELADHPKLARSGNYAIRHFGSPRVGAGHVVSRTHGPSALPLPALCTSIGRLIESIRHQEAAERSTQALNRAESVSAMVGGFVHDFRNSLQSIAGLVELLGQTSDHPTHLSTLKMVTEDAQAFVGKLTTLSRSSTKRSLVELGAIVEDAAEIGRRGSSVVVDINVDVQPATTPILGDPPELRTMMLNLLMNSIGAAKDRVPKISIVVTEAPDGSEFLVSVTDNGQGVDPSIRDRIFQPFVTDQGTKLGTGLGLAVAAATIADHGGSIELRSTSPKGTVMVVRLPKAHSDTDQSFPVARTTKVRRAADPLRVFICDDDPRVLDVLSQMVESLGYVAVPSPSAGDLLQLVDSGITADLCIVDQMMPGIAGDELILTLVERDPRMRFIWLTGGPSVAISAEAEKRILRVTKPVSISHLAEVLAESAMGRSNH